MAVLLMFWVVFAVMVGVLASSKGRSAAGWVLVAIVISPLLAFILVAAMPQVKKEA